MEKELGAVSGLIQHQSQLRSLAVAAENVVEGQEVLQTRTVPLSEVSANLPEWVEGIKAEYDSLTKVTGAIIPIHKDSIKGRTDVEFSPGKLVATIKPLGQTGSSHGTKSSGRKKARLEISS